MRNASFDGDASIKCFEDGTTNVSYNRIDRHLAKHGDQVAIIREGNDPSGEKKVTYSVTSPRKLPFHSRPRVAE